MNPLTVADFMAFFRAIHGVAPFPWQSRLVKELLEGAAWPETLSLPTASGKTSVMDAAVFALAADAGQSTRRHARRIFFVVDRRVVVDDAFERARKLEAALAAASDGPVAEVARRLRMLGDGSAEAQPLQAAIMRGGVYRDDRWTRSPAQPALVVSTVDQVGSRLLFRGYGVNPRAWPIQAGLVGNDALIILDEAHCSRPFLDTLGWVARYRGVEWAQVPPATPFSVVSMTATPRSQGRVFQLQDEDRQDAVLGRRMRASKPARLVLAKKGEAPFRKEVETAVLGHLDQPAVVGVIVNRVAVARELFEALRSRTTKADVILLTGRVRPAERDALLRSHADRLRASVGRPPVSRGLVVVATQCIEVGADLDFDVLVTECASLDALRQRFGRLNRLGIRESAPAVIVGREEFKDGSDDEPVYGSALCATWRWLSGVAVNSSVDFGVDALAPLLPSDVAAREALSSPSARAPILMPAHVDLWAQTGPAPHVSPDPAAYLHGARPQSPDVSLVWRADVGSTEEEAGGVEAWLEAVAACPPSPGESLSVPLSAARAWLSGERVPMVSDLEGVGEEEEDSREPEAPPRRVLRWAGPEDERTGLVLPEELRPGDTVVLPVSAGGCDRFGWTPTSSEPVTDLGDQEAARRRRAVLRLQPAVHAGLPSLFTGKETDQLTSEDVREGLSTLAGSEEQPEWLRAVASFLSGRAARMR